LGGFNFIECSVFWDDKLGIYFFDDSLGIVDLAKSTVGIFEEIILLSFFESGLIKIRKFDGI
jgi:hypothetical protein